MAGEWRPQNSCLRWHGSTPMRDEVPLHHSQGTISSSEWILIASLMCLVFRLCTVLHFTHNGQSEADIWQELPAISLGWGRDPLRGKTTQSTKCLSAGTSTATSWRTSPGCKQGFLVTTTDSLRTILSFMLNWSSRSSRFERAEYCTKT